MQKENDFLSAKGFYALLPMGIGKEGIARWVQQADSVLQINRQRVQETDFSEAFKALQLRQLELQAGRGWRLGKKNPYAGKRR